MALSPKGAPGRPLLHLWKNGVCFIVSVLATLSVVRLSHALRCLIGRRYSHGLGLVEMVTGGELTLEQPFVLVQGF